MLTDQGLTLRKLTLRLMTTCVLSEIFIMLQNKDNDNVNNIDAIHAV